MFIVIQSLSFQMRELAEKAINPHLVTIATLTGHAVLTVGSGYSVSWSEHVILRLVF
jgi:leucyl aminopeptidase